MSTTPKIASARILPLDGLRSVAVLGVIWIHCWTFFGNPSWNLGPINLNKPLAIFGNGVDLFFVISGFCMYLAYAQKQTEFSWSEFGKFVKNRWFRIAPAFYVCATLCAFYLSFNKPHIWRELPLHFLFLHTTSLANDMIASPFWSLATEWQFYLVLPALVWANRRYGLLRTMIVASFLSVFARLWMFAHYDQLSIWNGHIPTRLVEFLWGVMVAQCYLNGRALPRYWSGYKGLLIAITTVFVGRALMSEPVFTKFANLPFGDFAFLARALGEPILTLGYAGVMWNVLAERNVLQTLLSTKPMQLVGKWSYSMYLWHWFPCLWICTYAAGQFGKTQMVLVLSFVIATLLVTALSILSYRWLEAPYFRKRQQLPG